MNKSLAEKVRGLNAGYQGMDDQHVIAKDVEELEARSKVMADLLERAKTFVEHAAEHGMEHSSLGWLARYDIFLQTGGANE